MNILDYVDSRGDILFSERGFNEVDNLIFSELSYVEMEEFIDPHGENIMTIRDLRDKYVFIKDRFDYPFSDPWPLLDRCGRSDRFGDIRVGYFVKRIDPVQQFGFTAVTFFIDEKTVYIAFRGTDGRIEGWRECFDLSYLTETEGQKEAVNYLGMIAQRTSEDIIIGGHSKGGNFAEYAAAFTDPELRKKRIKAVYTNDGPGFTDRVLVSEGYREILPITLKIMPESSIVGSLLKGEETVKVIKGDGAGPVQHDPFKWRVLGTEFEPSERTRSADMTDETLNLWIEEMDEDERREFVEAVFGFLYDTGINDFSNIHKKKLSTAFKFTRAQFGTDREQRKTVNDGIKRLRMAAKKVRSSVRKGGKR